MIGRGVDSGHDGLALMRHPHSPILLDKTWPAVLQRTGRPSVVCYGRDSSAKLVSLLVFFLFVIPASASLASTRSVSETCGPAETDGLDTLGELAFSDQSGSRGADRIEHERDLFEWTCVPSDNVTLNLGENTNLAFYLTPLVDAGFAEVSVLVPSGLIELTGGCSDWSGNLSRGMSIWMEFSVTAFHELRGRIVCRADVSTGGHLQQESRYLRVSTPDSEAALVCVDGLHEETEVAGTSSEEAPIEPGGTRAPYTIEVSGYLMYYDDENSLRPMRRAQYEIWEERSWAADECYVKSVVPVQGMIDWVFTYSEPCTVNLYVKVFSENDAARCEKGDPLVNIRYECRSQTYSVSTGESLWLNALVPEESSEAFMAIDATYTEYMYISTAAHWHRYVVSILWPYEDPPAHYHEAVDQIHLPRTFDEYTVYHEYAHAVMNVAYEFEMPWTDFGGAQHVYNSEYDRGFAMTEGWAEFMEFVLWAEEHPEEGLAFEHAKYYDIRTYVDDELGWQGDTGDMDGDCVEGSVAALLWDLVDPAQDKTSEPNRTTDDFLSVSFETVFWIVADNNPHDIIHFWVDWFGGGADTTNYGNLPALNHIYWINGIDLNGPPVSVRIIYPTTPEWFDSTVTVSYLVDDVDAVELIVDFWYNVYTNDSTDDRWVYVNQYHVWNGNGFSYSLSAFLRVDPGVALFRVWTKLVVSDNMSALPATGVSDFFSLDGIPPKLGAKISPSQPTQYDNVTLTITMIDMESGLGWWTIDWSPRDGNESIGGNLGGGSFAGCLLDMGKFTPCTVSYHIRLFDVVSNACELEGSFVVAPFADSQPPIARAGPDRVVQVGTLVQFDGSESSDNSVIVSYEWAFDDGGTHTLGGPTPTYSFNDPGVYIVTLTVEDGAGLTSSDTMSVTVTTTPSAPVGFNTYAGDSETLLIWEPPLSDGYSQLWGYRIYRGTSSESLSLLIEVGCVLSYNDADLTNGVTYYYKITAFNSIGESEGSGVLSAKPTATLAVPSSPRSLQAIAGNAAIDLTWQAPSSDCGSPISGYKLYRGTFPGHEVFFKQVGNVLTYLDTGLTNDVNYYYQVTALNSVGESQRSTEVSAKPMSTLPPILSIAADADSSSGSVPLEVSFTCSATGGVTPYTYLWDFDDGNTSTLQNPVHSYDSPGTYHVAVTVTDSSGNSAEESIDIEVGEGHGGTTSWLPVTFAGIVAAIVIGIALILLMRRRAYPRP